MQMLCPTVGLPFPQPHCVPFPSHLVYPAPDELSSHTFSLIPPGLQPMTAIYQVKDPVSRLPTGALSHHNQETLDFHCKSSTLVWPFFFLI